MVKTDSDYAKCPGTRKSMTRSVVYLNGAPITFRSYFIDCKSRAECSSYEYTRCIVCEKHPKSL